MGVKTIFYFLVSHLWATYITYTTHCKARLKRVAAKTRSRDWKISKHPSYASLTGTKSYSYLTNLFLWSSKADICKPILLSLLFYKIVLLGVYLKDTIHLTGWISWKRQATERVCSDSSATWHLWSKKTSIGTLWKHVSEVWMPHNCTQLVSFPCYWAKVA